MSKSGSYLIYQIIKLKTIVNFWAVYIWKTTDANKTARESKAVINSIIELHLFWTIKRTTNIKIVTILSNFVFGILQLRYFIGFWFLLWFVLVRRCVMIILDNYLESNWGQIIIKDIHFTTCNHEQIVYRRVCCKRPQHEKKTDKIENDREQRMTNIYLQYHYFWYSH